MKKFGCTTPWGPNKDHICKNATLGNQADRFYRDYWAYRIATKAHEQKAFEQCPKSCTVMRLRVSNQIGKPLQNGGNQLVIKFYETIMVTEDHYVYGWLNLVAEVGGYVGLFLGISVYQFTDLVSIVLFKSP